MIKMVLTEAQISTPDEMFTGWLAVDEHKIVALGCHMPPKAKEVYDCKQLWLLPGGIDAHVHFRDPGFTWKEDFETGTAAAAAGGVTTVFDMPNTRPTVMTTPVFEEKRAALAGRAWVDYGLAAAVDANNLNHLASMAKAGAVVFEVFMYSPGISPPEALDDDGLLLQAFETIAATGRPAMVHAENNALVRYFSTRMRARRRRDVRTYVDGRPALVEIEAVSRALMLSQYSDVALHLCHLTSGPSADLLRAAKQRGQSVTADVCPQHLLLADIDYSRLGPQMKMTPPIRSAHDRRELWRAVQDGTIDLIVSDHAPHTAEEKLRDDMMAAASGFVGVETTLPLMLSQVQERQLSLRQLNQLRAENPARIFGLYPCKGVIQVGADADLVLVDPFYSGTIQGAALHSRSTITPFEGTAVRGAVVATWLRGKLIYHKGQFIGKPGGKVVELSSGIRS